MKEKLNIRSEQHLAFRLGYRKDYLTIMKNAVRAACQTITITTSKGKRRKVTVVSEPLKQIQSRILHMLNRLLVASEAHGWIKKRSVKTNAMPHCGNPAKLCLDLKDCFPNIPSAKIHALFEEELGCSPTVSSLLTRLTTCDYCLPQGFSTSGALVNLVFRPLDTLLASYAENNELKYTRYGDDISFSGRRITKQMSIEIKQYIINFGVILNSKKEEFTQGETSPLITGLNTSGPNLKVPRAFKRRLRAAKYEYTVKNMTDEEREHLQRSIAGREHYINFIEAS